MKLINLSLKKIMRILNGENMKCPICENEENNLTFIIKEMQIGLREEFEYIECSNCGCLFIKEIPKDIDKYYDTDYAPHLKPKSFNEIIFDKGSAIILSNSILSNLIPKEFVPPPI